MDNVITKSATIPLLDNCAEQFQAPVPLLLWQKAVVFCMLPNQVWHVQ